MSDIDVGQISEALNNKADLYTPCTITVPYTFNKSIESAAGVDLFAKGLTKGSAPTSTVYGAIRFNDNTSPGSTWQNTRLGVLEWCVTTANVNQVSLIAYSNTANSSSGASITLKYDPSTGASIAMPGNITAGGKKVAAWVTETYRSGTQWYRKYSDGWIEQGGYIAASSSNTTVHNLIVAMADTNYHLNITAEIAAWSGGLNGIHNKTTTSFQMWTSDDSSFNSCPIWWEAKGMAA